jgi:hypothetical protein
MARTILWAGRYNHHIGNIVHAARERLSEDIRPFTLSLPEQNLKDGSIFGGITKFLSENRLTMEPFEILVVGISWREFEYILEEESEYLRRVTSFRNNLDNVRFLNGRSAETVPVLLASECISIQEKPSTLSPNLYYMGTSDAFGQAGAGLLNASRKQFVQSLDVLGFSLVPEGDRVVPYIIARDETFDGHS